MEVNKTTQNTHTSPQKEAPFINPKKGLKGQGNFFKSATPFFPAAPNVKKTKKKAVDFDDESIYDIENKKNDITDQKALSSNTEEIKNESHKEGEHKKKKKQGDNSFDYVRKYSNTIAYHEKATINGQNMTFSVVERKGETYRASGFEVRNNGGIIDPNFDGYQDHSRHKYKVYINGNGEVVKVLYKCEVLEFYADKTNKSINISGNGNSLDTILLDNGEVQRIPSDLYKDVEAVANKRKNLQPMDFRTDEERADDDLRDFVRTFGGLFSKPMSIGSAALDEYGNSKGAKVSSTTLEKIGSEIFIHKLRNAADNGNYQEERYTGKTLMEKNHHHTGKF